MEVSEHIVFQTHTGWKGKLLQMKDGKQTKKRSRAKQNPDVGDRILLVQSITMVVLLMKCKSVHKVIV